MDALVSHLPPEFFGFVLTLGLSLLIGFEREEHEPDGIGGVRTFPIIGLGGFGWSGRPHPLARSPAR